MPPKHHGALVIFGSGPGIGVHVASRFARGGFEKVVLVSRDAARLRNDAFIVYSTAPQTWRRRKTYNGLCGRSVMC
jgi:NAD(P)-dependent dehydrogenase (short-subunit alcohol dehydrogenase family)